MVRNYKPRIDRATYDGALVARALAELDKCSSERVEPKSPLSPNNYIRLASLFCEVFL